MTKQTIVSTSRNILNYTIERTLYNHSFVFKLDTPGGYSQLVGHILYQLQQETESRVFACRLVYDSLKTIAKMPISLEEDSIVANWENLQDVYPNRYLHSWLSADSRSVFYVDQQFKLGTDNLTFYETLNYAYNDLARHTYLKVIQALSHYVDTLNHFEAHDYNKTRHGLRIMRYRAKVRLMLSDNETKIIHSGGNNAYWLVNKNDAAIVECRNPLYSVVRDHFNNR